MGWFDEQIRQRKESDDTAFQESFIKIAGAVTGRKLAAAFLNNSQLSKDAIKDILKYYHVKNREIPDTVTELEDQLEYLLRPYGVMRRTVELEGQWYQNASGAFLGVRKDDGRVVAFIPDAMSGYRFLDLKSGKRIKLDQKTSHLFEKEAICFYKPFPMNKMNLSDLVRYICNTLSFSDVARIVLAAFLTALVGMLVPKINNVIFSSVIIENSTRLFVSVFIFLLSITISTNMFSTIQNMLMARINTKMTIAVEAATMMRILSLPADFFKKYSAGELSNRTQTMKDLCEMLVSTVFSTGMTSIFSLIYIGQIFIYAPAMVMPALIITMITIILSIISSVAQMRVTRKQMELTAAENGMNYALISGVQKIKLSGSEKRAFARWGSLYAREAEVTYNPSMFLRVNSVLIIAISLIGTMVMYGIAIGSHVSVADYFAFNSAYGMVSGAFMALAGIALTAAKIKPIAQMVEPILSAVPEVSESKQVIQKLSGTIELNNVSFRYQEKMPLILDNLSLKVRSGQYVAIVGTTGCGKSTLMRLMLGFENPQKGAIYYDGKDITTIDMKSLRRKIGVVMQNGKLFQGDIYSNITISAPWLTVEDAWKAAETAGLAEDIRRMPMGMYTMITEGAGGISGGQKQRLMIARAIAHKPKILMLDEATSALDNITQKKVSNALDQLKCTRIVIAHRLSTIKQCDRIIVLDKGKIIEDGNYEELIQRNGAFAELVARQRLDDTEYVGKTTLY